MIRSFRHKGLSRYFERSETKGLQAAHVARIGRILDLLDAAACPEDMEILSTVNNLDGICRVVDHAA